MECAAPFKEAGSGTGLERDKARAKARGPFGTFTPPNRAHGPQITAAISILSHLQSARINYRLNLRLIWHSRGVSSAEELSANGDDEAITRREIKRKIAGKKARAVSMQIGEV